MLGDAITGKAKEADNHSSQKFMNFPEMANFRPKNMVIFSIVTKAAQILFFCQYTSRCPLRPGCRNYMKPVLLGNPARYK